jgi:predicted nucleic acid-binding protein
LRKGLQAKSQLRPVLLALPKLFTKTVQLADKRRADELVAVIKSWPLEFVHSDEALCIAAGEIKARFLVSFADALSVQLHSDLVRS